jgi:hypothetical protein
MKIHMLVLASSAAALALSPFVLPRSAGAAQNAVPFDAVSMTIEVNATNSDAGVILFSDTEEQLHDLVIQDPSMSVVYHMTSTDAQGLGLTEMSSETSEPDITSAFVAYPEGDYTFTGTAFDGTIVTGVATLSHTVPTAPVVTAPKDGAEISKHKALVKWDLDPTVDHYWVEIEQEDPPVDYTIQLPPGVHKFKFPSSLLLDGASYNVGVAAVGANGNATVSEVGFDTK